MEFMGKDITKEYKAGNLTMRLGSLAAGVRSRLEIYSKTDFSSRIWRKDATIWIPDRTKAQAAPELVDRLGWLSIPEEMKTSVAELKKFSRTIKEEGYKDVLLLGMGGSSLAPDVFQTTFGNKKGYPLLTVLDSTSPDQIREVAERIDLPRTLFLVASKSGGTLETMTLFKYFWSEVSKRVEQPGKNFVALTDMGSKLQTTARDNKFRKIFITPKEVGGRYSALTYFGLLPAALIGVDVDRILDRAIEMAKQTHSTYPLPENPSVLLGTSIGELALAGRDKLVLFASKPIASFGAWVEQLVAESTGKNGKGVLPVVDEMSGFPRAFGDDSVFLHLRLKGEEDSLIEDEKEALANSDHPIITIDVGDKHDLGGLFFMWEMATAIIGAVLAINPFDQPNVESAKVKTKEVMNNFKEKGELDAETPIVKDPRISLYSPLPIFGRDLKETLEDFFKKGGKGDYIALMAYLPRSSLIYELMSDVRSKIHSQTKLPTTLGFGPRFLHSTGQLHKGDAGKGLFIQVTSDPKEDLQVPEEPYTFGTLILGQALGDYKALSLGKRRVIRCHLSGDPITTLTKFTKLF